MVKYKAIRWAIKSSLTAPYYPWELPSKEGRKRHLERYLKKDLDTRVNQTMNAANRLGIRFPPSWSRETIALCSDVFASKVYTKYKAFCPQKHLVDIGAQYGDYSVLAAKSFGSNVVAFEPMKENFAALTEFVEINGLTHKIKTHNLAVGSGSEMSIEKRKNMIVQEGSERIRTAKLDEFKLSPDLLKLDVEGFEIEVLKGAANTIEKHRPRVIMETHSVKLRMEADEFLKSRGYKLAHVNKTYMYSRPIPWMDELSNRFYSPD
jgi:FkbM family methyltransferase